MASTLLKSARQGAYVAIALYVTIIAVVMVISHAPGLQQGASAIIAHPAIQPSVPLG